MKAFILAAGFGTRLLPYSRHTPKPLFTLNRRPVLDLTIERLQQAGFDTIIINTHHGHAEILRFLSGQTYKARVIVRHEPEILGTGGAVRNISDLWGNSPLLVINADIVTDIDPAQAYEFHRRHKHPVTMVMHHHESFNSVAVDRNGFVCDFSGNSGDGRNCKTMAFTGIHVMDPKVLAFIPQSGAAHIIDTYSAMLKKGERIKTWQPHGHYWQDIGTPERYLSAALDCMIPAAFKKAFSTVPSEPPAVTPLKGDGSDRKWFRLSAENDNLIMVDHGIHSGGEKTREVDAFVAIGRHLHARGAAVPRIYLHDEFAGLVFVEDLGDLHLQDVARNHNPRDLTGIYRHVIDRWLHMALEGYRDFNPAWTYQTTHYDRRVILENECRYFMEAFVQAYLKLPLSYEALAEDFETLADLALADPVTGFMHRDLQSRNIMLRDGKAHFIDFQGGRIGPLQYDLASLLIDPYSALALDLQDELSAYAAAQLARRSDLNDRALFRGYDCCAVCRNLQMLGAFAFLSRTKHKTQFETYIPRAVRTLHQRLAQRIDQPLPKLRQTVETIADTMGMD